jgi:hypothetical protein
LDPLFQTVKGDTQQESHKSLWQINSGFILQKDTHTVNKKRARPTSRLELSDPPNDIDELVRMPEIIQRPLPLPPEAPGELNIPNGPTSPQRVGMSTTLLHQDGPEEEQQQ